MVCHGTHHFCWYTFPTILRTEPLQLRIYLKNKPPRKSVLKCQRNTYQICSRNPPVFRNVFELHEHSFQGNNDDGSKHTLKVKSSSLESSHAMQNKYPTIHMFHVIS